ncbi:hypothetical protein [Consotaella aegiceratis]|uniref:hypothetical protein n=1 Tax=Consotaella aegiceratis TaxID=3097961 RepID=UPI002F3F249E
MDAKKWYESKTIWGSLVVLGSCVLGLFGHEIDAASGEALTVALTNGAAAVGAVVAIVGRLSARTTIG